jgi:F plasmid transfer operon, TraF, protein
MLRSGAVKRPPRIPRALGLAAVVLALASSARAQYPWAGARATGMGGAEVAAVEDNSAIWSNPAALAGLQGLEFQILGSFAAQNRNNLVGSIADLSELPWDEILDGERPDLIPGAIADILNVARPGSAVVGSGVVGLAASWKGFAVSIGDVPYVGIYPIVDTQHIVPGGGPDDGLQFNETGLNLAGLSAREARVGYGLTLFEGMLEVGAAGRYVSGVTYFARCGVLVGTDCTGNDLADLIQDAFQENARTTNKFTFDAGARVNLGLFKLGISGTSLTQPEFTVAEVAGSPGVVPLPRQLRGGVSVSVLSFLTVAADGDLIQSDTLAPGVESQQLSLGAEVKIPVFVFRGGATTDFAAPDQSWAYTIGLGLRFPIVSVDLAVLFGTTGGFNFENPDREMLGAAAGVKLHF